MIRHDAVEYLEEAGLVGEPFDDRLDDDVPVGHGLHVGGEVEGRDGTFDDLVAQLAGAAAPFQRALDATPGCLQGRVVALADSGVHALDGTDLGDARAHQPGADDTDGGDGHGRAPR